MNSIFKEDLLKGIKGSKGSRLVTVGSIDFFIPDMRIEELCERLGNDPPMDVYDLREYTNPSRIFDIHNRKYIGSKHALVPFLIESIMSVMGREIDSFFDCFSGTGVVAQAFRRHARRVIANDILFSNHVVHKAFIASTRNTVSVERLDSLCSHLNDTKPVKGYVYENFGNTYFTNENAQAIDGIREEIERLKTREECTEQEKSCMLASLIYAADKAANTVGQYDAFLKHLGSKPVAGGRHRVDSSVYKKLQLKRPLIFFDGVNAVHREDAAAIASRVRAEVAYVDPPYNSRQYVDCYHVLENIARWEKPATFGKTRKYPRDGERSPFSQKRNALKALSALVDSLRCEHVFLSYNSEGTISDDEIRLVLRKRGKVDLFEKEYPVFGNGAGVSRNRMVKERLYYCKVLKKPAQNPVQS